MNKLKMTTQKGVALLLVLASLLGCVAGCGAKNAGNSGNPAKDEYSFSNPEGAKAEPDEGIVIDGVLDEQAYQDNNWLYLHNDDGGNNVNIAMTSYYGEKGMYFVYDVTESVPIYVNPDRASYMNSCIEMYLVPSYMTSLKGNSMFEIDLMPTGDLIFKKSNGKYGYENVETTGDIMAHLGATTKGGEVNTPECYGYCLELFIPWEYLEWLKIDTNAMKNSFVYVNPAHITSNNYAGTDTNIDRYWYHYAQQNGSDFNNVAQYFRFDGDGVIGSVPVELEKGVNCTISGVDSVIPGLQTVITVTPDVGHALTSILVNGEEQIRNVSYEKDGSVILTVLGLKDGLKVSAKAEPATEGNKSLTGKVVLNSLKADTLDGVILSYNGPKGERPLEFDKDGNFELKDMEQGYYVLTAEKEGYITVKRGIYLNRDIYTEVTLEADTFSVTGGVCFVLDDQNEGVLYKFGGTGNVLSNVSFNSFTFSIPVKYDTELAKQGTDDLFTQQRSGMRIQFSNDKTWHIDVLKEKNDYIVQYAKFSGNQSVKGWKTLYKMKSYEIEKYCSEDGIKLTAMRQGQYVAIWLGNRLLIVEKLNGGYKYLTAKLGVESWVSNRTVMEIPFTMKAGVPADIAGSHFLCPADGWDAKGRWDAYGWDISGQYDGFISKTFTKGRNAWLDSVNNCNDVTTLVQDQTPEAYDLSWAYIFKFSNKQQLRLRIVHEKDENYYVQTMSGGTLTPNWKNYYKLTEEQAAKIQGDGIEYRVEILETTAYVSLDGEEVCTIDLSEIHKDGKPTGKPSEIESATNTVAFSLEGNYGHTLYIPFELKNSEENATVIFSEMENGIVTADQEKYKLGDTITLTVAGNEGYYYDEITVDGQPVDFDWNGTYSFIATNNRHYVSGRFSRAKFKENSTDNWNVLKQNQNVLLMNSHATGNSGWLESAIAANDITTTVKDTDPATKNFSMIYHYEFSNGETLVLRLNGTDNDGKYRVQVMSGSTLSAAWKNHYTLSADEEAKIKGEGVAFRVVPNGQTADVYLDGVKVCSIELSKSVTTDANVKIRMDGNLNKDVEVPFRLVDSAKVVTVNIAEMTGGKITSDKTEYMMGDTIILTVAPDAGYSQKIYVNEQPLLLDWKTDTYTFEAAENVYEVTGGFEKSLDIVPKDAGRWDTANQAHGVMSTYYPANNDSWWVDINGEYRSVSVTAKNYLTTEESKDDGGSVPGFHTILRMVLDNGKAYAFRIYNDKGTYAVSCSGESGAVTGWSSWKSINDLADAITGDGVNFKVERTAANKLAVSVNGNVLITYTMDGVTAANKVVSVGINSKGNKNEYIDVPFVLKTPTDAPDVTLNIAEMTNGTVTPELGAYQVGDTITLNVAPDAGYSQRLYVDGEPLKLDWKTNTYSFEATKEVYNITGSFEPSLNLVASDVGRWDTANQAHGVLNTYYPSNNDSWWMAFKGDYKSLTVKAKNYLPIADTKDNFMVVLRVTLDNGKVYSFRVMTDKGGYTAYNRAGIQNAGDASADWGNWKNLSSLDSLITTVGVDYKVERASGNVLKLSVNGEVLDTYTMAGVTADNKITEIAVKHQGNKGQHIEVPYVLKTPTDPADVQLNIAALTNGKVIADRTNYMVGDTITLTVTPDAGYAQKLYINGEALKLDWKTNTYSFVATEEVYNVTGSFEPSLNLTPSDAGRWDTANQAHGVLNAYYPNDNDSWWVDIEGEYRSVSVKAKNYLSIEDSKDGINGSVGFATILRVKMDNGKIYAFRVYNDKGTYAYAWFGNGGSATGWGGWKNIHSAYAADFNGDGVDFKLERTSANTLTLSLNDTVVGTYTMADVTAANKVVSVGIQHNGNKGQKVEIPYVLKTPTDAPDVTLNIAALTNGTVTADKESYKVGDTVTLTVAPDAGYAQKLYINGEALKLDWKTNTYSFEATEKVYNVTGSFAQNLNLAASDAGRWDTANQAHGILNTYYPSNNDSWWMAFKGEYASLTVKAKNYLPIADTKDNFMVVLRVTLDNGRVYSFRVMTDKGGYTAYNRAGIQNTGDASADWGNWRNLSSLDSLITTVGVDYKVERTAGNVLTLSVNGDVLDTYTMAGVTADNKITEIAVKHQGNKGEYIEIPYVLTEPVVIPDVTLNIPENLYGGTITADKESYKVGDTVTLTVAAEEGYAQKLYINGKELKLDWKTNTYSFEATEEVYNVTGSFAQSLNLAPSDAGRWDTANQAHGVVTAYYPDNGDSWWMTINGEYSAVAVTAKNYLPVADSTSYEQILRMTLSNGKSYAFRVYNDKGTYAVSCTAVSGSVTGWGNWKKIGDSAAAAMNGNGVQFKVERTSTDVFTISVNGEAMFTYKADGVTADTKVVSVGMQSNGNKGQYVEIPFTVSTAPVVPDVTLNIPENLWGGTVTADKESYKVGDTVTLTVTPEDGCAQSLYINGKALKLDWKTNTYSFVATEEVYNVTGYFAEAFDIVPKDAGRWDTANQAHGVVNTYYPANNDSWWVDFNGEYKAITVTAKNYLATEESKDDGGSVPGYHTILRMVLDNGKAYAFRIYNDKGTYAVSCSGESGAVTGWGNWKNINDFAGAITGEGVAFKVERTAADKLVVSANGNMLITYTMDGVTAANKVVSVGLNSKGNKGQKIEFPFTLEKEPPAVTLNLPENLWGGTVTADKESYKAGDTITLTVSPEADYCQKLYINGKALLVDANSQYSFVAEAGKEYNVTGSFASTSGKWFWTAGYGLLNQGHGIVHAPAVSEKNGELVPTADKCYGGKVLVKDPSQGSKKDFAIVLKMAFSDGSKAEVRLVNKDGNGSYMVQSMSGILGSWKWYYDLSAEENAAVANGDGVWFGMVREGTTIKLTVNGNVKERSDVTVNIPEDVVLNQVKLQTYNFGYAVDIPYEFYFTE